MTNMKKILFALFALVCATASMAQNDATEPIAPKHFAPLAKVQADQHGIIRDQPEGELRTYTREGQATYVSLYFRDDTQTGIVTDAVFTEDGQKVYIKNIVSHAATGTWVEGSISGNTITIPLGQMVYWWDKDENGKTYGMKLARVKVKGSINEYEVDSKGTVTFTMEGDKLILNGTSGNPDETVYDGLGLVYTDEFEGEWSYYIDYETVMTRVWDMPVTPPDDLMVELYSLENEKSGHLVRVGFSGDDVYVQGVSENNLPAAWMKGTISGSKLVFPAQCAGQGGSFLLYFCGAPGEYVEGDDGYYSWIYDWSDGSMTFDYDAETRSFRTDQTIFLSNSKTSFERGEVFHAPLFRPFVEQPATPADPSVVAFITDYFEMAGLNIAMFDVPLHDTEGRFMDPAKLSYRLYCDDDEPFILYTDEYKYITQDMEEVPYLFSDRNRYIYEKAYALYVFQTGFDRFGIQTIYRGGGEEHRSNISYWYFNDETGIRNVQDDSLEQFDPSQVENFDLQGRRTGANQKGLVISRLPNGRVVKTIRR